MKKSNQIFIDPNSNISYSTFYIKGMYDVFGKENVKFSSKHFNGLARTKDNFQMLAFVLVDSFDNHHKYIVDYNDPSSVNESLYKWADIYAKINFNKVETPKEFREKLVPIPPGMGIKIWSLFESIFNLLNNFRLCGFRPAIHLKYFITSYYLQSLRPRIEHYLNNTNSYNAKQKPYIFQDSGLWPHKDAMEKTNLYRNAFYTICKQSKCIFEGGFRILPQYEEHPQLQKFKKNIFKRKYSPRQYLEKTQKSLLIFNTPSVHNCHGWRLCESLASGKAIMSTKLYNEIPVPLEHGKIIHFISNNEDFKPDFDELINNREYRQKLEKGAKKYFIEYASPEKVIKSIVSRNIENHYND